MSAGPSPPNPGTPRKPLPGGPPRPSNLGRYGPGILAGGVILGIGYAYFAARPAKPAGTPGSNPMRTPGTKNIEKAYQNSGATSTHTKAYGGTEMGQKSDVERHHQGPGQSGTGKPFGMAEDKIGEEQRPTTPTKPGEAFHDFKYGSTKGK